MVSVAHITRAHVYSTDAMTLAVRRLTRRDWSRKAQIAYHMHFKHNRGNRVVNVRYILWVSRLKYRVEIALTRF